MPIKQQRRAWSRSSSKSYFCKMADSSAALAQSGYTCSVTDHSEVMSVLTNHRSRNAVTSLYISDGHLAKVTFYSARNARIASAVLATAIPSVCPSVRPSVCLSVRPSDTRRYCVKTTARSTMQFSPLDSKMCLVL